MKINRLVVVILALALTVGIVGTASAGDFGRYCQTGRIKGCSPVRGCALCIYR